MDDRGSYLKHYMKIMVEGFDQQKLLNECITSGIILREIRLKSEIEMTMILTEWNYQRLLKLARNRYRITILYERGYRPLLLKIFNKKSTIAGLILFALIFYYQGSFVSEIRITGYEKYTETQIRESLREAGLYEGCPKQEELSKVKLHIYQDLDNIAWIGVKYTGNMAEVTIVEGTVTPKPVDQSKPCNIIADKEGYLDKVIAREGKIALAQGSYIKPGDVIISGIVPITSTAYGTSESALTERYVHASGEAYARIPYRFSFYQEKYDLKKELTGEKIYGLRLEFGNLKFNGAKWLNNYDSAVYSERVLLKFVRPIPVLLAVARIDEVQLSRKVKSQTELKKEANQIFRTVLKEKIPKKAQLLNKSLKFSSGENIIRVSMMLETLEEIGAEKEITVGESTDRGTEDQN